VLDFNQLKTCFSSCGSITRVSDFGLILRPSVPFSSPYDVATVNPAFDARDRSSGIFPERLHRRNESTIGQSQSRLSQAPPLADAREKRTESRSVDLGARINLNEHRKRDGPSDNNS